MNRLTVTRGNSDGDFGGGIYNGSGTITLRSTVVARSPSGGGNCGGGAPTDGGYNMEDDTSCSFSEANNSLPNTDPMLVDALADNGGPTKTLALRKGSPAVDLIPEGANGCGTEVTQDQRGVARPQGGGCDTGAFEKKVRRM